MQAVTERIKTRPGGGPGKKPAEGRIFAVRRRWRRFGILYFALVFSLVPALASAYIDPSVTTYAIQAIAGVAVAAGAFFATYGRRMRKQWKKTLDIDGDETKTTEAPLEISREDLKEELRQKREGLREAAVPTGKKKRNIRGRIITSLLCGFAPALALILRPIISFYLANEGDYWFRLSDVMPYILALFLAAALGTAVVHFILPAGRKVSLRLLFAACAAAGTLCVFVQDHFLSFYLPVLTGDDINWGLYRTWNYVSIALWGGAFVLIPLLSLLKQRFMKSVVYGLLLLLLVTEAVTGTVELATATHSNRRTGSYFTQNGMYETSEAGNVVVLVSDTFEGTYMNRLLEEYPEIREMLPDVTYYDNVTGISIFTHYSFAKLMTGQDFPLDMTPEEGMTWCFENQTTIDRIRENGWEIGYYTEYSPPQSIEEKIINYSDEELKPNRKTGMKLTELLFRGSLFRSAPHPLKWRFIVYTINFEHLKYMLEDACPYLENDMFYYNHLREEGLTAVQGAPRYSVTELFGLHEPSLRGVDFELLTDLGMDDLSVDERKIQAGRAQMQLLRAYLDDLKAAGTYDRTTVIMTADHGFNQRFYPMFLVKEAGRQPDGFRVDSTPISMQEDYEDLIAEMISGKTFSEAAAKYTDDTRVRTALDFRSPDFWAGKTNRRSLVEIRGEAKDPASYHTARDEFVLDDAFPGRMETDTAFFRDGSANGSVAVYGLEKGTAIGHSVVFDAFSDTEENRPLIFRATVTNRLNAAQRLEFSLNGKPCGETVVEPKTERKEIVVRLPEGSLSRRTLEIDMPDAALQKNAGEGLAWNVYFSIEFSEAGFYVNEQEDTP